MLGDAPEFARHRALVQLAAADDAGLRGRVVLVDFWTYTCINCLRTLPYIKAWDERYRAQGLTIVGVHTPEFAFEKQAVERPARRSSAERLRYPVVQDNDFGTWNAFRTRAGRRSSSSTPTGSVRYAHLGEGEYEETEAAIRTLLAEAGDAQARRARRRPRGRIETVGHRATPETYLGSARAQGFSPVGPTDGTHDYTAARRRGPAAERLQPRRALARRRASPRARCAARRSPRASSAAPSTSCCPPTATAPRQRARRARRQARSPRADAGDDVRGGAVTVRRQRLYSLVKLDALEEHVLTLRLDAGVSGFAFTFG